MPLYNPPASVSTSGISVDAEGWMSIAGGPLFKVVTTVLSNGNTRVSTVTKVGGQEKTIAYSDYEPA